jgi:hypothetical protein
MMTRDELLGLPVTVDLQTAGRAIGCGRAKAYQLHASGQFPVRVLRLGTKLRVVTADLWDLLGVQSAEMEMSRPTQPDRLGLIKSGDIVNHDLANHSNGPTAA